MFNSMLITNEATTLRLTCRRVCVNHRLDIEKAYDQVVDCSTFPSNLEKQVLRWVPSTTPLMDKLVNVQPGEYWVIKEPKISRLSLGIS